MTDLPAPQAIDTGQVKNGTISFSRGRPLPRSPRARRQTQIRPASGSA
jgi:hypothetical protein